MIRGWGLALSFLSLLSPCSLFLAPFLSSFALVLKRTLWLLKVLPAWSYFQSFNWRHLVCLRWGHPLPFAPGLHPLPLLALFFCLLSNSYGPSPSISLFLLTCLCCTLRPHPLQPFTSTGGGEGGGQDRENCGEFKFLSAKFSYQGTFLGPFQWKK